MSNEELLLPPQSFSSIQSRRVLGTLEALELCPSMDLCVYHTSTSTDIPLYRTISWQRVATIRQDDTDTSSSTTTTTTTTMTDPCSRCCWSPSGRWIAVARERNVHLYGVEPLANPPEGYSGSNEATAVQHGLESSAVVTGLYWAHVGRAHPTAWNISEDEAEDYLSWR
jgi:WD40 repeat protein